MSQEIVPGHLAPSITGHAAEHATQSGFHSRGNLVMRAPRGNAVDEGALFVTVGKGEIVQEAAVGREFPSPGSSAGWVLPDPRLRAQNLHRTRVGNGRRTARA